MLFKRSTKIVATIGPASEKPEVLEQMIEAGLNVARLNFSHGTKEDHQKRVDMIRAAAAKKGVNVGILQDLQGPKIRTGKFKDGPVTLEKGQKFILTADDVEGNAEKVSTTYKPLPQDVSVGMTLLLDDGNLELRIKEIRGNDIITEVEIGGVLSNNKGINVPEADLSAPALSDKDIADLGVGAEIGVDWVALSFVRSRDDLILARHHLRMLGSSAKLMAKIEKPQAVDRFDEILAEADGIMVARGDLGVEMPTEQVPVIQKMIIRKCREAGKPVITATQMLESMRTNPRPTRAEASDVANAIFDGTDAVMLSAESASGMYPVESVGMMFKIAETAESTPQYEEELVKIPEDRHTTQDAIAHSASEIARFLNARAIVCFTSSGATAARVSRRRPRKPILALTPNDKVVNQLALMWGVVPLLTRDPKDTDDMVEIAVQTLQDLELVQSGDRIVIVAGVPFGMKGTTNTLRVARIP